MGDGILGKLVMSYNGLVAKRTCIKMFNLIVVHLGFYLGFYSGVVLTNVKLCLATNVKFG